MLMFILSKEEELEVVLLGFAFDSRQKQKPVEKTNKENRKLGRFMVIDHFCFVKDIL